MASPDKTRHEERRHRRREWAKVMNLSVIGMVFPVALLMGYFAGRYLGGLLGNPSLGGMIGALLGIVSGFYNIFKMMDRYTSSSSSSPSPRNDDPRKDDEPDLPQ